MEYFLPCGLVLIVVISSLVDMILDEMEIYDL